MAISDELIEHAIDIIALIEGIEINQDELVEDVVLVADTFKTEQRFKLAIAQIKHSLELIIKQRQLGQALVNNYAGWWSFHFQSSRVNGQKADLRIVYQDVNNIIRVRGFGHRHLPQDVYERLKSR